MDGLLAAMQRDMATRNTPFVLVVIPSPIDACDTYDYRIDTVKYPSYDARRISRTIDSLAGRHGIKRIDLWEPFRAQDACALYYRDGDLHWNEKGQSIAAAIVADSLAAWGFLPAQNTGR
jgi:hypothetical protein